MNRPLVIAATPTPFDASGEVDLEAARLLYKHALDGGVDALFVAGTTGEFPALEAGERVAVYEAAVSAAGPERVIAHVGAASAHQAVRLARAALALGVRRLAMITPYYLPASPDGVVEHFTPVAELAAAADAELYVYAFEARTGCPVPPELLARLAALPAVTGVKVSGVPGTAIVADYVAATPPGFTVLSGNDHELAGVVRAGGHGVVSGISSVLPGPFTALAEAVARGDAAAERAAQADADAAVRETGGDVGRLKAALEARGLPGGRCRMAV